MAGLRQSPLPLSLLSRTKQLQAFLLAGHRRRRCRFFTDHRHPSSFSWNATIRALSMSEHPFQAIAFYYNMVICNGVPPDHFTYPFVLTACARVGWLDLGRMFHGKVIKFALSVDVYVVNSLMRMYGNCGCLQSARRMFDESPVGDVVSWNVLIGLCVRGGFYNEAFLLFDEMVRTGLDGVEPDEVTMLTLISGCSKSGDLDRVRMVCSYLRNRGFDMGIRLGNAVVDAFCKCGDLESALHVFSAMSVRDVFTWTSLISGFASSGNFLEALGLFGQMQMEKVKPDEVALVCALSACAQVGALDQGRYVHFMIERYQVKKDVVLMTAVLDMYAKCGRIDFAFQVFYRMKVKNVFTWNAMIGGLAVHGHGRQVLSLFEDMKHAGFLPDDVTFIGVLSACSHSGLVNEGNYMFGAMQQVYKIKPRMEHYGCVVDLFCRAGMVDDAFAFMEKMPINPNAALWAILFGACRKGSNTLLAEKIGKRIITLEPNSCGRYVLLSNYYAGVQRWDDALKIRNQMKSKGIEKVAGFSWIEMNSVVYQFVAGDKSHPQTEQIYLMVEEMCQRVKLGGHVAGTSEVLFNIEEEEKENSLFMHSEKLAIAFGLISSAPGSTLQIVKNLRVCNDCHSFLKVLSHLYNRIIIVRDRSRFHHFKEGSCSCMDFW